MTTRLFYFFGFTVALISFTSCTDMNQKEGFQLSNEVKLENGLIFNPLFIDGIFNNPNRAESIWNDSLLKICGIKRISISLMSEKNPEEIGETTVYDLDKHGDLVKFWYYDYAQSKKAISKSQFYYTEKHKLDSIDVLRFYGVDSKNKLRVSRSKHTTEFIYDKGVNKYDHIVYYYTKNDIQMMVKKIGDIITHIVFIVPEKTPMSTLKKMSQQISMDSFVIESAEKSIIYSKNHLPSKAYTINSDWAQLDLVKDWGYDKAGNLITYKEFINRSLVKDMLFNYSEDNLLRSINFNSGNYLFDYN